VMPQSIISVEEDMVGEFIACKPIETARSTFGIITPNIEYVSYDTLQKPVQNIREFYTDRGRVVGKNKHYKEGEVIWWGDEGNVRLGWNGGFLVRRRMVLAYGKDAERMNYVKRTARK
jgi:hypothetical protein